MFVWSVVLFCLASVTIAEPLPQRFGPPNCDPNTGIGCLPSPDDCPDGCTCNTTDIELSETEIQTIDRPSEKTQFKFVKTVTNYGSAGVSDENDLGMEDSLTTKLNEKVHYVFRGIIVSAALFVVCACICVMSVCMYCCHIRKRDRILKQEVNAIAKKLKIDVSKKAGPSRKLIDPIAQSCNVVVQDANVLCV